MLVRIIPLHCPHNSVILSGYYRKTCPDASEICNSSKSNFIQLADICNFYINRYRAIDYGCIPKEPKATHIIEMYKKIEPLIFTPDINPFELKNILVFFNDNKEILNNSKK